MKRLKPEEVTFLHICRRRPKLRGWWPKEIYSLGITDRRIVKPDSEMGGMVLEAMSYFYQGSHEPYYPHILCLTREPLVLILQGLYVAKGHGAATDDDQLRQRIDAQVRPTWAFVNTRRTHAVPAPGGSREIWPGSDHKIEDKSKIPRSTKLLRTDIFDRLRREDPRCFLKAFGFS